MLLLALKSAIILEENSSGKLEIMEQANSTQRRAKAWSKY